MLDSCGYYGYTIIYIYIYIYTIIKNRPNYFMMLYYFTLEYSRFMDYVVFTWLKFVAKIEASKLIKSQASTFATNFIHHVNYVTHDSVILQRKVK